MSRRDRDDRPRKLGRGIGLALVLSAAGVLAALAIGGAGLIYLEKRQADKKVAEEATARQLPTRDEFRAAWVGKSRDELLSVIGKPDATEEYPGDVTAWTYNRSLARDPVTDKPQSYVVIKIDRAGRIVGVIF